MQTIYKIYRVPLISSAPWLTSKNWLYLGVPSLGPCLHPGQDWQASFILILAIFLTWLSPPSPLHGPAWKIWPRCIFLITICEYMVLLICSAPWLTSKYWMSLGVALMDPCPRHGQHWMALAFYRSLAMASVGPCRHPGQIYSPYRFWT